MSSSAMAWPPALKSPAGEASQGCSRNCTRGVILPQRNVDIHTPTVHIETRLALEATCLASICQGDPVPADAITVLGL